jgi:hypothetical protein
VAGAVTVVLNDSEIRAVAQREAGKLVIATTVKILNRAKILCPVDTGNLRSSLQMKITRSGDLVAGAVFTNVEYAKFVHAGTRAHMIRPRRPGGVLAFPSPPRSRSIVFARSVRHPGTRARPFLAQAIEEVAPRAGFASRG